MESPAAFMRAAIAPVTLAAANEVPDHFAWPLPKSFSASRRTPSSRHRTVTFPGRKVLMTSHPGAMRSSQGTSGLNSAFGSCAPTATTSANAAGHCGVVSVGPVYVDVTLPSLK
jgi:hypothetical protein